MGRRKFPRNFIGNSCDVKYDSWHHRMGTPLSSWLLTNLVLLLEKNRKECFLDTESCFFLDILNTLDNPFFHQVKRYILSFHCLKIYFILPCQKIYFILPLSQDIFYHSIVKRYIFILLLSKDIFDPSVV